jgi:hypothetical protein
MDRSARSIFRLRDELMKSDRGATSGPWVHHILTGCRLDLLFVASGTLRTESHTIRHPISLSEAEGGLSPSQRRLHGFPNEAVVRERPAACDPKTENRLDLPEWQMTPSGRYGRVRAAIRGNAN